MSCQKDTVLATRKVKSLVESLKNSMLTKNSRLIQKYVKELKEALEDMLEALVAVEIEGIDEKEPWLVNAREFEESGQAKLFDAEKYLLEIEDKEECNARELVNEAKLKELVSSVTSLSESLKTSAIDLVKDVDKAHQPKIIHDLIDERKCQMSVLKKQKLELFSTVENPSGKMTKFEENYNSVSTMLNDWIEIAIKYVGQLGNVIPVNNSSKGPGLKLDRLSLPVFKGNVRAFARFVREFESTVGVEFQDPKIKVMYLQNQCLAGPAKELVRNLITYEDVMSRLKERYGKLGLVVDSVLKDIKDCRVGEDESNAVIALSRVLEFAWDDLVAIDALDEFCNVVTLGTLESKLPSRIQILWAQEKPEGSSRDAMHALKMFIEKQRKIAQEVLSMRSKSTEVKRVFPKSENKSQRVHVGSVGVEPKKKACFRCGFGHLIKDCKVPNTIICRRCKRAGHIENACRDSAVKNDANKASVTDETQSSSFCNSQKEFVKLPIEQVNTNCGTCTVLWDSGSMINLISNDWAKKKGLEGKRCSLDFKVVDNSVKSISTKLYDLSLISKDGVTKGVKAYGIDDLAAKGKALDSQLLSDLVLSVGESIKLHDIDNCDRKVDLLLGSSCIGDFPVLRYKFNDMCLMSSEFGTHKFVVVGNHTSLQKDTELSTVCHAQLVTVTPLHDVCEDIVAYVEESKKDLLLKDFSSVEELGVRPPPICKTCKNCGICKPASQFLSLKEYRELNIIKSKLAYNENGKFWTAGYPFLKSPSVLSDNYVFALKALERRETRLKKNESLMKLYDDQVNDFVNRGVISKLSELELKSWNGPVRYVDHHEVFKEGSTTPLRIVINSSFRNGNELSFNDILMKGPNVLTSLLDILIRWRLYPVAFVGDVSKMYHNVRTGELEGHLRRLLWRDCDQSRSPDIYCFNVVTFGDRPAGCIAVSALKATADMFSNVSKKASEIIRNDSYMDDVVSGANSMSDAERLVTKIEDVASRGGFKFKRFQFSKPSVDRVEGGVVPSSEKVLGVTWEPLEDTIRVNTELNHNKRSKGLRKPPVELENIPFSRRVCLRLVNGIYDPLGLISPVVIRLKILMKEQFVIGSKYKKWDTLLVDDDRSAWIEILEDILLLNKVHIPRHCIDAPFPGKDNVGRFSLVCFSDASKDGMCAAVYIRFQPEKGEASVGLLASKTRVSPAKAITIPRLELCAALLGARLLKKVTLAISFSFEFMFFFIDSKIVLGSLNNCSLENDFTGNCVAEIRSKTDNCTFAWIQSSDNISDLGTRGVKSDFVREGTDWQNGPAWLREPVESWPVEICHFDELPTVSFNLEIEVPIIDASKFSSLHKLHKVTALCLKFASSRGNGKGSIDSDWRKVKLSSDDYKKAEQYWIRVVSDCVHQLYKAGKLQSLRPVQVWDEQGKFLKVVTSGRLGQLLKVGYDVEELVILDPKHPYSKLVLKEYHDLDHGGDDRAVWKSREKFWIPQARNIVRKIRANCYRCKLLARRSVGQLMAPLPSTRVLPTPAWTFTSLDLFGPLEHSDMVRKRLKEKCWGVLFTCTVSRAVHLDLTQGYDCDSLLQSIRRFMAIRGAPKEFLSDQGSQLVACSKEIVGALELIDWSIIDGWCAKRNITWKFIPPQAQHMNGVSESLVRSTKHVLKQTLEGKRLTFAETQTVLYEAAQLMNCRPIGIFSRPGTDPLDGGPITPNHLLLGRATNHIPDLKFSNVSNTKRIRFLQTCIKEYWDKWKVVVFHSLVPQYKWHRTQRNLQVGDIVLLNEDTALVGEYRLGQVHSVKIGSDGLVRSVEVRYVSTKDGKIVKGMLERPVHKICVIVPVEEQ